MKTSFNFSPKRADSAPGPSRAEQYAVRWSLSLALARTLPVPLAARRLRVVLAACVWHSHDLR